MRTWALPGTLQTRLWPVGALAASGASVAVVTLAGYPATLLVTAGLLGSVVLGVLPFRWVMTILIVASGFTSVEFAGLGVHLRLDIALVPAALLSCVMSNRLSVLALWLRHPVMKLLAGYVAVQFVVSWVVAPDPAKSLSVAMWLLLNLLIVALALACFGEDRSGLIIRLTTTGSLVVSSGVVGWVYVRYLGGSWGASIDPSVGVRATGIALEPNILGGTAAIWTIVMLTKGHRLSARHWTFVMLCMIAIVLTTTRAALIAIVAGALVYFLRDLGKARRLVPVIASALVAVLLVQVIAPSSWSVIVAKVGNLSDATATYRANNVQLALTDMRWWNWLVGLGTNTFGQRHVDPTLIAQGAGDYLGNLPFQTLYESGLLGLALLLSAGWQLSRAGNRARRLALLVTFLVISSATSPFYFGNWWLFIALGLAGAQTAAGDTRGRELGALASEYPPSTLQPTSTVRIRSRALD